MANQAQNEANQAQETATAELEQQIYFEYFGDRDWDLYHDQEDEHVFLKRFIGFALFNYPTQLPTEQNVTGYKQEENEKIESFFELFLKNNLVKDRNIYVRLIYICWNVTHENKLYVGREPVFVLKKCQEKYDNEEYSTDLNCKIFIDRNGRVYDNWACYLNDNQLPECTMVCPKYGQYKGVVINNEPRVLLEYHESPACGIAKKALNVADMTGVGVSVLTTVGGLASLVVAAPALLTATAVGGAATATYMVGRNIYTLADRALHQQSIGLDNSESRWSWFGIGTGVIGTAATTASGIARTAASQGKNISKGAQVTLNVLNGANIVGSSAGIVFCGYNLFDKFQNNETITPLEIFQFSASVLFFYRSVVDFQTAENLISKAQKDTLQNYEKDLRSKNHRKIFRKALKETERINGGIKGRAEVISGLQNIGDKDAFFAGLVRVNKDFNKAGARFEITGDGNVRINSAHIVDPHEFASMNRGDRINVLNNLPPRQITITNTAFKTSSTMVIENFEFLNKVVDGGIAVSCIIARGNADSFALLVAEFNKKTVKCLFKILYKFLDEIQNSFQDIAHTFRMAPIAVAVMQYLINYLKNKASAVELELEQFIQCVFNEDGSVNTTFLQHLVRDFHLWFDKIFRRNRASSSNNNPQLEPKKCKVCSGHYYKN